MVVAAQENRNWIGSMWGAIMFVLLGNSARSLDRAVILEKELLRG